MPHTRHTLKFRLTLYYAAGFLISLVCSFAAILLVQRHLLLKSIHQKINFFTNEFTYEYLAGHEFPHASQFLEPRELPAKTLAAFHAEHPGAKLQTCAANADRRIELVVTHGDETFELTFSADHSRIERTTPLHVPDRVAYLNHEFNEESYGEDFNNYFFLLLSPNGQLLARSPFTAAFLQPLLGARPANGLLTLDTQGTRIRLRSRALHDGNTLLIGANLHEFDRNMRRLLLIFSACFFVTLSIGVLIGYFLARKVSNAVNAITAAAREIEAGDFTKRVHATRGSEELDALAAAFNDMTARTERLVAELKTISENIAHDLRTPLTRMHGKAELAMISGGSNDLAGVVAEECGDMLEMVNTMLEITQIEYNIDAVRNQPTDLRDIVAKSVDLFSTLAEDKEITLAAELPDTPVIFKCSASKIQRMVANLIDNAIKFTPRHGRVDVRLELKNRKIILRVSDTGSGIHPDEQPHVFDRFFRSSFSRSTPGNGLGLSFVRAVVTSHNGTVRVESAPGKGAVFVIELPA